MVKKLVKIDSEMHKQLRIIALDRDLTLQDLVERILKEGISKITGDPAGRLTPY